MNAEQARVAEIKAGYEAVIPSLPRYTADKDGNIRSYCGRKVAPGTVLKTTMGYGKYRSVNVCDIHGKRLGRFVHELVAEAFLGPRPKGLVIDHIDGNRFNNAPSNLRYCTMKQNHDNPCNVGPNSYQRRAARKIIAIKNGVETLFENATAAARELHVDLSAVMKIVSKKVIYKRSGSGRFVACHVYTAHGYTFRWA